MFMAPVTILIAPVTILVDDNDLISILAVGKNGPYN